MVTCADWEKEMSVPLAISCTLLPSYAKWYTYSSSRFSPCASEEKPKWSAFRYLSWMASCTPAAYLFGAVKPCVRQLHGNYSVSTPQVALQHMQEHLYHTQLS